jgi:starch synthase
MNKAAIAYSDAIVIGDDAVDEDVLNFVKKSEKPVLAYDSTLDLDNYYNFYQEIASDELVSVA